MSLDKYDVINSLFEGGAGFFDTIATQKLRDLQEKKNRKNRMKDFRVRTAVDLARKTGNVDLLGGLLDFANDGRTDQLIAERMPDVLDQFASQMKQEQKRKLVFDLLKARQEKAAQVVGREAGIPGAEMFQPPAEARALARQRETLARVNEQREKNLMIKNERLSENINVAKGRINNIERDAMLKNGIGGMGAKELKQYIKDLKDSDAFLDRQEKTIRDAFKNMIPTKPTPEEARMQNSLKEIQAQRARLRNIQNILIGLQEERSGAVPSPSVAGPPAPLYDTRQPEVVTQTAPATGVQEQGNIQKQYQAESTLSLAAKAANNDSTAIEILLQRAESDPGDVAAYYALQAIKSQIAKQAPIIPLPKGVQGPPVLAR